MHLYLSVLDVRRVWKPADSVTQPIYAGTRWAKSGRYGTAFLARAFADVATTQAGETPKLNFAALVGLFYSLLARWCLTAESQAINSPNAEQSAGANRLLLAQRAKEARALELHDPGRSVKTV